MLEQNSVVREYSMPTRIYVALFRITVHAHHQNSYLMYVISKCITTLTYIAVHYGLLL